MVTGAAGRGACYNAATAPRGRRLAEELNPTMARLQTEQQVRLDDGAGLRVADAQFLSASRFEWGLFSGYDSIRALTYSASIPAIVRMLDERDFTRFECVFGCESTLHDIKQVLVFQQVATGDVRAAIKGLSDPRHVHILEQVRNGRAAFRVLRKQIAHAKLYLLEDARSGNNRVIIGSANLSETAFSGRQPETLVKFDNDELAWEHYVRMYEMIRDEASDKIELPPDRIGKAEIELAEVPAISGNVGTLVIHETGAAERLTLVPEQIKRFEKVAAATNPLLTAVAPPFRNGAQRITPQIKREIRQIRLVKSTDESDNRYFALDRAAGEASLDGEPFSLEWDGDKVRTDAELMIDYFKNYEGAFRGNVARLQRDYFTLWAWLYFSPFMCDLRNLALVRNEDIIRYPSFAVVFGKSNCGKSTLLDMLTTSMFGKANMVDKASFTTSRLRALQQGYKRFPVVFDDIGRNAFNQHGREIIKNEMPPPTDEFPGFVLSMNAEPTAFPDEIVKRCLMIYTTTALPPHNESLRQAMDSRIRRVTRELTGHLYRRYLAEAMDKLSGNPLPEDWLLLSSETLRGIIVDAAPDAESAAAWLRPISWLDYADKRYDRVKTRLDDLLRPSAMLKNEGDAPNGWLLEENRALVVEQRDAFGRRGFNWEDVPSTLIDEDASSGGRTVLHRAALQEFLGRPLAPDRRWWPFPKRR